MSTLWVYSFGLPTSIVQFEEKMCERAGRIAQRAEDNLREFVHPDAPHPAIRRFKQLMAAGRRED